MTDESPEEFLARAGIREVPLPPNAKKLNGGADDAAERWHGNGSGSAKHESAPSTSSVSFVSATLGEPEIISAREHITLRSLLSLRSQTMWKRSTNAGVVYLIDILQGNSIRGAAKLIECATPKSAIGTNR